MQTAQYVIGTTRVQPELTNVYNEQADLTVWQKWLEGAAKPQAFPEDKNINIIQVIAFYYEVKGQTMRTDSYMLVTFKDGTLYMKQIRPPNKIQDVDPYNESENDLIIRRAGMDGWCQMGDIHKRLL
ncbi:hypothetical protein [Cohnella abietis]|uniref:Uncharacterized protein n=1 Tax=Cohnella abietis TaxID=2507935 RepID=A0A3T1D6W4_9BACL|nr:hypothetical protein [Cohnella abietis]BBI33814.1 hypothetical protein KCTCHS21_32130 [Cohnella abietis]